MFMKSCWWCLLFLLSCFSKVFPDVIVLNEQNETVLTLHSLQARFGDEIPSSGIFGHGNVVEPLEACTRNITPTHHGSNHSHHPNYFAIIKRRGCNFYDKVRNAELANYTAAIVYNVDSDDIVTMTGTDDEGYVVKIPSVFIGESSFNKLSHYLTSNYSMMISFDDSYHPKSDLYLIGSVLLSLGLVLLCAILVFIVSKIIFHYGRKCAHLLRSSWVKKLPTKRFVRGDRYEVCAVCLEDYTFFDKLRILPCSHAFHQKCIDPWLTRNKQTCPLCNKRVRSVGDGEDAVRSGEERFSELSDERTPLVGSLLEEAEVPRPILQNMVDVADILSDPNSRSNAISRGRTHANGRIESTAQVHTSNVNFNEDMNDRRDIEDEEEERNNGNGSDIGNNNNNNNVIVNVDNDISISIDNNGVSDYESDNRNNADNNNNNNSGTTLSGDEVNVRLENSDGDMVSVRLEGSDHIRL